MLASRVFRSGFVWVPMAVAAAIAAGCSDDDPVTPAPIDDGGDGGTEEASTNPPVEAGATDAAKDSGKGAYVRPRDPKCDPDLDVDKLYKRLSCAGLYSNIADKTVDPELMPYKPSSEFWSDGAEKTRWIFLPKGYPIDSSDMNDWVFPVGTRVFKEFKIGGKRIETRLYEKYEDEWKSTTYRWKADESDAERLEGGESIPGLGPGGATPYEIPNTSSCSSDCHAGRKDFLLGFDAVSLGLPNATGLTLAELVDKKLLTKDPPTKTLAYPSATEAQGGATSGPAMAWLHINCGSACHNRNPNSNANFTGLYLQIKSTDLMGSPVTVDKLDAYAMTVCKASNHQEEPPNVGVMKLVRSGAPTRSWISVLSNQRMPAATLQMPPVATRAVDTAGHKLLDDWITALTPACPD